VPLGVAGFVEGAVANAALSNGKAISDLAKGYVGLEASNSTSLASVATSNVEGTGGLWLGVGIGGAGWAGALPSLATAGAVGAIGGVVAGVVGCTGLCNWDRAL